MLKDREPTDNRDSGEEAARRQLKYARLQCFFAAATAVCCVVLLIAVLALLPSLLGLASDAEEIIDEAELLLEQAGTVMDNLETASAGLAEADLAGMVKNVDALVSGSQEGIVDALEKLNGVDFDSLNKAIGDFASVVEPLAKFFNRFG